MSLDPAKTNAASPNKSNFTRYLLPLALLVAMIGGLAWVAQQLPRWTKDRPHGPTQTGGKAPLEFVRKVAQWGPKPDPLVDEKFEPKDYEPGKTGHYDFPFKNNSKDDVEVMAFATSCNCTSVQAAALDEA